MKKMFFVMLLTFTALAAKAQGLPVSIAKAHQAYGQGDGQTMLREMKASLIETNNHPSVVQNMAKLYSAARFNGLLDGVQPDWKFPEEVTYAGIEVQRRLRVSNSRVTYHINLSIGIKRGGELEQLQVLHYPQEVVIDKANNVGEFYIEEDPTSGDTDVWVSTEMLSTAVKDGLYLINLKLKGKPAVQAWLIMSNKNASLSPKLVSPVMDQVFTTPQPNFIWDYFSSPQKSQKDQVRVSLKINNDSPNQDDVANMSFSDTKKTSYVFGSKDGLKEPDVPAALKPGRYFAQISYREVESFGGIEIRRASVTKVPFSVK